MSSTTDQAASPPSTSRSLAGTLAILGTYAVLGGAISFGLGRTPGTLPDDILRELAPAVLVIAFFLYYSIGDVMGVGISKRKSCNPNMPGMTYKEYGAITVPEQVYFAQRVQSNQVEQMPVFIVGTLGCAVYVNGSVAGIMGLLWCLIRIQYAITYRGSVGLKYEQAMKGITKFTIPAYFLSNSMVMATGIHALRCLLSS